MQLKLKEKIKKARKNRKKTLPHTCKGQGGGPGIPPKSERKHPKGVKV